MSFMCPKHRQQFAQLPAHEKLDCWLVWMKKAVMAQSQQDWHRVVAHAGCAFDLVSMGHAEAQRSMHMEITLSAIFLCNTFRQLDDGGSAMFIVDVAYEQLEATETAATDQGYQCSVADCISALHDWPSHQQFFMDYLNWPLQQGNGGSPLKHYRRAEVHTLH